MGIRDSFTAEKWTRLVSLPYAVSMAIVLAAPSLLGTFSESKALITEPARLAAYKEWVLAIGQRVAEAAKEQGVAVSLPEKALLNEIAAALGLSA